MYSKAQDGSDLSPEALGVLFNKHWFDQRHQLIGVGPYKLENLSLDVVLALFVIQIIGLKVSILSE